MKCPQCSSPNAYQPLLRPIECENSSCSFYIPVKIKSEIGQPKIKPELTFPDHPINPCGETPNKNGDIYNGANWCQSVAICTGSNSIAIGRSAVANTVGSSAGAARIGGDCNYLEFEVGDKSPHGPMISVEAELLENMIIEDTDIEVDAYGSSISFTIKGYFHNEAKMNKVREMMNKLFPSVPF